MGYIANVENSEIDVSGIRTVLVQGDSSYPVIRFVLDPALTGLHWRVRGTYLDTNIAVLSPEIVPTESVTEITLDWSVGSDFTTYDGDMQLSLVGANDAGTTVVKALADIAIQKDWSIGSMGSITLNLFEQLMAQASAAISKYPTIIGGNWYVWNVTTEQYDDTGIAASSQWKSGTGLTGTSTTPTAFPSSGITMSNVGDMYLNSATANTYRCTTSGAASVALWVYVSNIQGTQGIQGIQGIQGATGAQGIQGIQGVKGDTGAGVAAGGAIRQALVKTSSADYATEWANAQLQYGTMPTATVDNLGQIAQFTGTTGTYTHGHVYECVSSGGGSPTYSWSEIVYGDPNSVSYDAQTKTASQMQQARANIAAANSNRNLLDNADWRTPINQLSKTGAVTNAYCIDRWIGNGTVTPVSGSYVTLENATTMIQRMEIYPDKLLSKTVTVSVEIGGSIQSTQLTFPATTSGTPATSALTGVTVEAGFVDLGSGVTDLLEGIASRYIPYIKLTATAAINVQRVSAEFGTTSTLAMSACQNYEQRLLACKRFFQVLQVANTPRYNLGLLYNSTQAYAFIYTIGEMRKEPTPLLVGTGTTIGRIFCGASLTLTTSNVTFYGKGLNQVLLEIVGSGFSPGLGIFMDTHGGTLTICANANL